MTERRSEIVGPTPPLPPPQPKSLNPALRFAFHFAHSFTLFAYFFGTDQAGDKKDLVRSSLLVFWVRHDIYVFILTRSFNFSGTVGLQAGSFVWYQALSVQLQPYSLLDRVSITAKR